MTVRGSGGGGKGAGRRKKSLKVGEPHLNGQGGGREGPKDAQHQPLETWGGSDFHRIILGCLSLGFDKVIRERKQD